MSSGLNNDLPEWPRLGRRVFPRDRRLQNEPLAKRPIRQIQQQRLGLFFERQRREMAFKIVIPNADHDRNFGAAAIRIRFARIRTNQDERKIIVL